MIRYDDDDERTGVGECCGEVLRISVVEKCVEEKGLKRSLKKKSLKKKFV